MKYQIKINDRIITHLKGSVEIIYEKEATKSGRKAVRYIHKAMIELEYECGLLSLKEDKEE